MSYPQWSRLNNSEQVIGTKAKTDPDLSNNIYFSYATGYQSYEIKVAMSGSKIAVFTLF